VALARPWLFIAALMTSIEETFDALHKSLPFTWNGDEKYDTVNPFGDPRQLQYHALWTFDTQNDVLRYTNRDGCSQILLGLLRDRFVSLADMESVDGPVASSLDPTFDSKMSSWKPQIEVMTECVLLHIAYFAIFITSGGTFFEIVTTL
jgi:hypothetical protein